MQIRRVLLLFALVLGLSALVASLAPPPEEAEDEPRREATPAAPEAGPVGVGAPRQVRLSAEARPATRRIRVGSSFSLAVSVPTPGDVLIDDLGLRQSADRLSPARFGLLAERRGRHAVSFVPIEGKTRVIGRLAFVEPATVTRRQHDR